MIALTVSRHATTNISFSVLLSATRKVNAQAVEIHKRRTKAHSVPLSTSLVVHVVSSSPPSSLSTLVGGARWPVIPRVRCDVPVAIRWCSCSVFGLCCWCCVACWTWTWRRVLRLDLHSSPLHDHSTLTDRSHDQSGCHVTHTQPRCARKALGPCSMGRWD